MQDINIYLTSSSPSGFAPTGLIFFGYLISTNICAALPLKYAAEQQNICSSSEAIARM